MSAADKRRTVNSLLVNNAMYIIIALVVIFIAIRMPAYRSVNSIVNIVNLTAAKLPIALGIAGCIVLTGTDISAGRMVGLAAVIVASMSITANKIFPGLEPLPIIIPLLAAIAARAMIGFINGFSVAKFDLHPFIMTLATQLITYGIILIYLKMGTNNGQTLSGFDPQYRDLVTGTLFTIAGVRVPMYVLYSLILVGLMWVVWNKTTFGKNMFAVGSNKEAAEVSGINVHRTIILVFVLAAVMYALTGFIDGARVASVNANTGLNYECDAIAACVIGGVSFVGGIGRISVKTLDKLIMGGILVIALLIIVGVSRGDGYRVTYDSRGGSDVACQTYLYDEPLETEVPQREGYRFEGWYFDEGYGRQAFDGMNVQSDLTLYAKWVPAADDDAGANDGTGACDQE